MIKKFNHKFNILPEAQQIIWDRLVPAKNMGFVLYGGTALALRLGHRQSVDFDFFSEKPLDIDGITGSLPFIEDAEVLQASLNTYTLQVPVKNDFVKISFFGTIDHGRVGDPELTGDMVILTASMEDILASKLKVILQRIEEKDYIDISAILESGLSLEYGIASAAALYGKKFSSVDSIRALGYFEDPNLRNLDDNVKRVLGRAVSGALTGKKFPEVKIRSFSLLPG